MSLSLYELREKKIQLERKQDLFGQSLNPWDQWLMTSKYKRFINMEVDIIEVEQEIAERKSELYKHFNQ